MTLLDEFNAVTHGDWITMGKNVQYKIIDDTLYFQASVSFSDWVYNFLFVEETYTGSDISFKTHRGFKKLWLSIKPEIEKLEFKKIVGYSQGAALAGFAHENFYHRKGYESETIVFGCPKFLWMPKKELLDRFTKFNKYKTPTDIVTKVPMGFLGYKSPGKESILYADGIKKPNNVSWFKWLSGHNPKEYRQRLTKIFNQ